MDTGRPRLETGFAGDIWSTCPTMIVIAIVFGALLLVWLIGVILSFSYYLKDLHLVRPTRGRSQSQSRGGSAPR